MAHDCEAPGLFFSDGVIPEIEVWNKSFVQASGYIWNLSSAKNAEGLHPFSAKFNFQEDKLTTGVMNIGEEGFPYADWNDRDKTRWDGLLYPDQFKHLRWAFSFWRDGSNWRAK